MKVFKNKNTNNSNTFTKIWVGRTLQYSWICIFLSYVLAFLGRDYIAETLACNIITSVIAVCIGYFAKSFFETREEKKIGLQEKELNLTNQHGVVEEIIEESDI